MPLGPERLPSLAGGEGTVWEKEAGQAISLHGTGEICFQKKRCKSRCCRWSAGNCELYCTVRGSEGRMCTQGWVSGPQGS